MKRLVFIHGRSQEHKDALMLKGSWIDAWKRGLEKSGLSLPITEDRIRFPYYGDTLYDLCQGKSADEAADVIVRGAVASTEDGQHIAKLLEDYIAALEISEEEIEREMAKSNGKDVKQKGPQNWGWVQAVIRVIDHHVPGAGLLIAMVTNDVHQYLSKDAIRTRIENGVIRGFDRDDDNIVVSHSLGTVVAYKLLNKLADEGIWRIPLLVTLGSPLGIHAIRKRLAPIKHPACVTEWFNALDPNDVVSLYPLDRESFNVSPAIINKVDVINHTENQHGIDGYLDDKEVARRIYDVLV